MGNPEAGNLEIGQPRADSITLSPSLMKVWVRCKKQYYWKYRQKLMKVGKSHQLALGTVVSKCMESYYNVPTEHRSSNLMMSFLEAYLLKMKEPFVGKAPDQSRLDDWSKVENITRAILRNYHNVASKLDTFEVLSTEHNFVIPLTDNIKLRAIPDAVIALDEDTQMIFEHKCRSRYRKGDFGIDYQSVACCLVANCAGTIYNVLEYAHPKLHRDVIHRSLYEIDYFKDVFINIGNEILVLPDELMYPSPMKRCACDYWELCLAEMSGIDLQGLIDEMYVSRKVEVIKTEDYDSSKEE